MTRIEQPPRSTAEAITQQTGEPVKDYYTESATGAATDFPAGREIEDPGDIYRELAEAIYAAHRATTS